MKFIFMIIMSVGWIILFALSHDTAYLIMAQLWLIASNFVDK